MNPSIGTPAPDSAALLRPSFVKRLLAAGQSPPSPLSFAQERLWFLDQLEPNSPRYNMLSVARLTGTLHRAALEQSLAAIVARHETLRTRFLSVEGEPFQVVDAAAHFSLAPSDGERAGVRGSFDFSYVDLTDPSPLAPSDGERAGVRGQTLNSQLSTLNSLSPSDGERGETELQRLLRAEANRPFNLSADRLLRVTLFRLSPQEHVLLIIMHHIISDEWSFNVFYEELAAFYAGFVDGAPPALPELPIQYRDYACWQREWLQGEVRQLRFWKEQLSGNPAATELPADHPRPSHSSCPGAFQRRTLKPELTGQLRRLAQQERATLFMVLLAGFKALLYRYTRQEDILVGSPMTGRNRLELEELIGFFVNTLPLRTRVTGDQNFLQLLAQVRRVTLDAYSHQDLPFEKLVAELHPERSAHLLPFVRLMFLVQNDGIEPPVLPGLQLEFLDPEVGGAKFDLLLAVQEDPQELVAVAQYNADLFEAATIARLLEHYEMLLQSAVAQPAQHLSELALLSQAERRQVLVEWNQTRAEYPRSRCVQELFEEQARLRPEAKAIIVSRGRLEPVPPETHGSRLPSASDEERARTRGRLSLFPSDRERAGVRGHREKFLTYGELNARANQLAHHLRKAGVYPGMRVGICVERSLEMVVGLLGILKAGAAYAPLDPGLPKERLLSMLEDLEVPVLLTRQRLLAMLPEQCLQTPADRPAGQSPAERSGSGSPRVVCLDTDWKRIARESAEDLCCEIAAEDLAYISFTSGSTGRPKGVCVPHRGIVRLVKNSTFASFSAQEVFLQMAPIAFDASLFEIWGPLLNGGQLIIAPPQVLSLSELVALIHHHQITTMWLTAGLFNQWIEEMPEGLKSLRQIITGGEVASLPHILKALRLLPHCRLINGYGPTENTTFTTTYLIPPNFDGRHPVPIGRPVSNTECYILDAHLQPVPIGVPGELYAGGDGLAAGYLNRPELTAERFVTNPFNPGTLLYKTGDLARYLTDGAIEFLGRIDQQVKIRGFRVELGEIEARLSEHPGVRDCAVVTRPDAAGLKQLVAYIVPARQPAPDPASCQRFLQEHLPDYMVPAFFVTLPALPLSPTGKIDRQALPAPEFTQARAGHAEPRNAVEQTLQGLWETILQVRPIGLGDKFFALGGHSLLAVRLVAQVEKAFGKRLPVAAVFEHPTIEQMARLLREEPLPERHSSIVEIQSRGSHPPLFLVHGAGGGMFWGYNNLARHLGPDQPIFAFNSRGLEGLEELEAIEALAESYLADLRQFQPSGPYFLGGYCFGGVVAYEMAHRLHAQGEPVALVALINAIPPNSSYGRFRWTPLSTVRFAWNVCRKATCSLPLSAERWASFLRWRARRLARFWQQPDSGVSASAEDSQVDADQYLDLSQYPEDQRRLWQTHIRALTRYQPPVSPIHVTLFRSPLHLLYSSFDARYGWGEFAKGGVTLRVVSGAHDTIMEEPRVRNLAAALQASLEAARRAGRGDQFCSRGKSR